MIETVLTAVDIRTAPRYPANDQVGTYPSDADEVALGHNAPAADASTHRDVVSSAQDETSESQLMAR